MSDAVNHASLGTDMVAEQRDVAKAPLGERAVAFAYLTLVGIAMAGWLYGIVRAALAAMRWIVG
ncbi:hypothetical protein [Bradyrhizobium sp. BR 10289]|uniref:hypothetical protein n=1 Tax=Bradyrhizobium sp. BR 10289 TaxID=2749993 RepID=UPI001C64F159|nr:hypothetical protein [Bradyrhizobium sp. BR 10289]MBW7971585.1 hypothetical protein [Bradyrhizobium sp. BR 10289]